MLERLKNLWDLSNAQLQYDGDEVKIVSAAKPKKRLATIVEPTIADQFPNHEEQL